MESGAVAATVTDSPGPKVTISANISSKTSFAHQQNGIPFIRDLQVTNITEGTFDLELVFASDPPFAERKTIYVQHLRAGDTFSSDVVDVALSASYLSSIREATFGRLTVEAFSEGKQIGFVSASVQVLAFDEWAGLTSLPELIAAFSQPNHPDVDQILRSASQLLSEVGKKSSLEGYQAKDKKRVWEIVSSIHGAVCALGLTYANPPASFEVSGQKIRTADRILENRLATCLDLCVLFSSCFEQAGLHPVVLMKHGHAFAGVWLNDDQFPSAAIDDLQTIRKRSKLGDFVAFETTLVTGSTPAIFEQAVQQAASYLGEENEFEIAVDVHRARLERIFPLPFRTKGGEIIAAHQANGSGATLPVASPDFIEEIEGAEHQPRKAESPTARLERWKRKLLDLTLRNRLLNFRPSKSTVPVLCADPAKLEDALAGGSKLRFRSISSVINPQDPRNQAILQARYRTDSVKGVLAEALAHGEIYSELPEQELLARLTEIYRSARTAFEEGGANTLFLAFGFLCWTETASTEKVFRAPLILVPVSLERKSVQHGFTLLIHDDEARVNASLLEMLRQDFELDVKGVDPLPTDDSGIHVDLVWQRFRRAVKSIPRWEVQEDVHLGLFSFAKYLMWKDLQDRTEDLKRSPVVQHLLDHPGEAFPDQGDFPDPDTLDDQRHPSMTFAPLVADSSQLSAVYAAADGKSFVLDGPPGTGKSQTITNIIAQCLANSNTVLFVSEKMAALEVVQRRLKQIGLERFCLQLHSAKAKKTDVIEHLGKSWNAAKIQANVDWQLETDRVAGLRDVLNRYVRELHRLYPNGLSPFAAAAKVLKGRGSPEFGFGWVGADLHSVRELGEMRDLVEVLRIRAERVGGVSTSPFKGITASEWTPSWEKEFKETSRSLHDASLKLGSASSQFANAIGIEGQGLNWKQLRWLEQFSALLLEAASVSAAAIVPLSSAVVRAECLSAIDHLNKWQSFWKPLNGRYGREATQADVGTLLGRVRSAREDWWLKSWLGVRSIKKAVAPLCVGRAAQDVAELERDLQSLVGAAEQEGHLHKLEIKLAPVLKEVWKATETDPAKLQGLIDFGKRLEICLGAAQDIFGEGALYLTDKLRQLLEADKALLQGPSSLVRQIGSFRQAQSSFTAAFQDFTSKVRCDQEEILGKEDRPAPLEEMTVCINRWLSEVQRLRDWCNWNEAKCRALSSGLNPIVDSLELGKSGGHNVCELFDYNYSRWWLSQVLDSVPVLCNFISDEHERKIEAFVNSDEQLARITRDYLSAKLSQRVPRTQIDPASNSELGLLAREMNKKSRHVSLRTLIQKMPTVLSRLTPCLMMSPMSVAQYLDAAHPLFDVVVFDEASQIPVWDSIGAIARGKQLVVAGDPKQLPPTNFFARSVDYESDEQDENEVEELESILDECNAVKLAPQHLNWHYRSRNESLIAFSNSKYYEGRLITFPSPVTRDTAVRLHSVGGIYDRAGSRTNRSEAQAVVEFVVSHLRKQNGKTVDGEWQTVGVVTFNAQQQSLIEDLLDSERQKDPSLEPYFSKEAEEYVLVKNLENVQGDERDIMVFSITYGADAAGRRSMNFGPLNREGGERRLNVAITRARTELHVFSSLGPEHIDPSKTRKRGVLDLKHFLEYAQRGPRALAEAVSLPGEETESLFEQQVLEMLQSKGWTIHPQVGCSGYRIDLGVVDPRTPGRYLLGIECDGAMYHSAATARDRDRLRAMVLRGLGWKLHRIWSTDWWANPERESGKVHDILSKLVHETEKNGQDNENQATEEDFTVSASSNANTAVAPYASLAMPSQITREPQQGDALNIVLEPEQQPNIVYSRATLPKHFDPEEFYYDRANLSIRSDVLEVINLEGPVSEEVLVRRISEAWGFARSGNRIRERILGLIPRNIARNTDNGVSFFWPEAETPNSYSKFRVNPPMSEAMRSVDEICRQELTNLVVHVVKQHAGVSEEQTIRDACQLLGIRRVTESAAERMRSVLKRAIKSGAIGINGESLV